jgi:hypothetical protein
MDRLPAGAAYERVRASALEGTVVGHGLFRLKPCDVQAARRRPGPVPEGWKCVPPTLLRYSDEQTIAGVAAVFTALADKGHAPGEFHSWGVVAAPRFLGRANLAKALRSFAAEGVWGTSPHLIPHFALHSLSGSISLALGLHGPNLGVGGGLHAPAEGFLAALTWLAQGIVPGVWVVLSGWSPELVPGLAPVDPASAVESECQALALALVPAGEAWADLPSIRIVTEAVSRPLLTAPDLPALAERLARGDVPGPRTFATDASGRIQLELVPAGALRETMD